MIKRNVVRIILLNISIHMILYNFSSNIILCCRIPFSKRIAEETKESFAKLLHVTLFQHLVLSINEAIEPRSPVNIIGISNIAGFSIIY